jgi:hypothetical protein
MRLVICSASRQTVGGQLTRPVAVPKTLRWANGSRSTIASGEAQRRIAFLNISCKLRSSTSPIGPLKILRIPHTPSAFVTSNVLPTETFIPCDRGRIKIVKLAPWP